MKHSRQAKVQREGRRHGTKELEMMKTKTFSSLIYYKCVGSLDKIIYWLVQQVNYS